MTHLEDDLRAALTSHTVSPSRDLLGAATRRHRRRRAVAGGAVSAGALGLAAVLAFGTVGGPGGAPAPTPVVQLSVAALGERMALAAESRDSAGRIEHMTVRITQDGATGTLQLWQLGDGSVQWRAQGHKGPRSPLIDTAVERTGTQQTTTNIDHETKTWQRTFVTVTPDDRLAAGDCNGAPGLASDGSRCTYTAEAIREATRGENPAFEKVGEETVNGRDTIKLRDTQRSGETRHLWVDADTYEIVRIVSVYDPQAGVGDWTVVEDFEFLAPTETNLDLLQAQVPGGYKRLPDRTIPNEPAAAPKAEPGPARG